MKLGVGEEWGYGAWKVWSVTNGNNVNIEDRMNGTWINMVTLITYLLITY